jgi:hypothetical protein
MITAAIITFIAIVVPVAVVAYARRRQNAKRQIRASFGPEYARAEAEYGGSRAADRELARRSQRLVPISADDRDFYTTSWEHIRGGFRDDQLVALSGAEQLTGRLLAARGYPVDDLSEQLALLSVRHGRALADYRQALWVSERLRISPMSMPTEAIRAAVMQYQALFADLLTAPGAVTPRGIKESEAKA